LAKELTSQIRPGDHPMADFNRRRAILAAGAFFPIAFGAAAATAQEFYWPSGGDWATATPAAAGFDGGALSAAVATALADNSTGVIILKGGRIVAEAYAGGRSRDSASQLASAAKSVVSTLIGIAIDQGHIKGVDQSAADFIPEWKGTPKAAITVRHLLTMTSGLHFQGLKVRGETGDQFAINAATGLDYPPGSHWAYATPMFHLLYHIIAKATGERFEVFAQRVLTGPLGMEHWTWITSPGRGADGPVANYYTAACSLRDLARFGLFALRGGQWKDRQLVSSSYFRAATTPSQKLNPAYGYLWWLNAMPGERAGGALAGYRFGKAPRDTFGALGAGGQVAIQVPSLDLVVARQGRPPRTPEMINDLVVSTVAALRSSGSAGTGT
jgi:CubicO group peptidase (beta-lactamase class C family)